MSVFFLHIRGVGGGIVAVWRSVFSIQFCLICSDQSFGFYASAYGNLQGGLVLWGFRTPRSTYGLNGLDISYLEPGALEMARKRYFTE